jgi:two-component system sensor kinase FixL
MFGWSAAELVGRPVTILMPPNVAAHHEGYVVRFLRTGQSGILNVGPRRVQGLRKGGALFDMELSVAEASVANRTTFIGVCRAAAAPDAHPAAAD